MNKNVMRGVAAVGVLVVSGAANAAGLDLTAITAAGTDIAAVGAAVFGVAVGIQLFKWIRRAL